MNSNLVTKIAGIVILVAVVTGSAVFFLKKKERDMVVTYSTSDAGGLKGEVSVVLDSWIGYFPLRSTVFGNLMREAGYRVKVIDDHADYPRRMAMLKKGKVDFAVCTVDSYLLNGKAAGYPGIIIAVLDESKGGDAAVAWKERVSDLNGINTKKDLKIAYTPASPSEHLLKSLSVHFDIDRLKEDRSSWSVEVDGAEEAYRRLADREVDMAVLWEPYVTEALELPGIVKLIGSEDMEKLIVDILLVNRNYARNNPEIVKLVVRSWFETLEMYGAAKDRLENDIVQTVRTPRDGVRAMLGGVRWLSFPENARWFGLNASSAHVSPELIESITSTAGILVDIGDFSRSPLPDGDPYTIVNSGFIAALESDPSLKQYAGEPTGNSLAKKFSKLSDGQWKRLRVVGSLRLRPVSFRSGTEALDENGKEQLRLIVDSIRHYPNYRILIKGHTGLRGDQEENRKLSSMRAESVRNDMVHAYGIDPNRILVSGMGAAEPLPRRDDESDRSYNNRLKRVEVLFMTIR